MIRLYKRSALVLLVFCLGLHLSATAYAAESVDMEKRGSVLVEMEYDGVPVTGGSLTLYYVADIKEETDRYSFLPTEEFAGADVDFSEESSFNLTSKKLAQSLTDYVQDQNLTGVQKEIDTDGKVTFADLKPALYLIVQEELSNDEYMAAPFLITVPLYDEGKYEYQVNAAPKVEVSQGSVLPTGRPEDTDEPQRSEAPDGSDEPQATDSAQPAQTQTPAGGSSNQSTGGSSGQGLGTAKLPQTGQLNWPIPLMAISGMLLFAYGWRLQFRHQKECRS